MATPEIEARARELTDEQLRWVQDDVALDGCPLCDADACLEACEALADKIDAYVRELAAETRPHIPLEHGAFGSMSHERAASVGMTRPGVIDGVDVQLTAPLGRAVLRVLGEESC